ncbi:hypothetical protein DSM110093_02566 [Sulfitobacter sp. DSM 110093]|uniref:hypothetical protein n=1 Tax=Sulfitobacter sp. DSM 110093 TaxID=2883127 RepID=UPI001FAE4393|nr:hypothetical protein [Sulfitobacter sp. DSM 110093]UOA32762.1 hypothetical protein DSM110093_02566 [Sulfitobacter sp. DSM 110093]
MKHFNAGATHRATHAARLRAANDLVQRTLAQHGLAGQAAPMKGAGVAAMPSVTEMLSKLGTSAPKPRAPQTDIPKGAAFRLIHTPARQAVGPF